MTPPKRLSKERLEEIDNYILHYEESLDLCCSDDIPAFNTSVIDDYKSHVQALEAEIEKNKLDYNEVVAKFRFALNSSQHNAKDRDRLREACNKARKLLVEHGAIVTSIEVLEEALAQGKRLEEWT